MATQFKTKTREFLIGKTVVRLTPWRRFFLVIWTGFIFVITYLVFRRVGGRVLMAALVLGPLIGGLLLGFRLLGRFDEILSSLTGQPAPRDLHAVLEFLRSCRQRGQFRPQDLQAWCQPQRLEAARLLEIGLQQGWIRRMGQSLVITSAGDAALD